MDEMNKVMPASFDIEAVKDRPLPANVDPHMLNQPLPKITRADDNKRKRSSNDE